MNESAIFESLNLSVSYGRTIVLKDISLTISSPGKLIAIVGPNGAGKSSFIKSAVGILKPFNGSVRFWGKKLMEVRGKISYIPQRADVDFSFPITVEETVMMGAYRDLGLFSSVKRSHLEDCKKFMEMLDILNRKDENISQLSGGLQQRVLIARSLMQKADIYFLDEPFVGLDLFSFKKIISILRNISEQGKTVIVVHHDLSSVKGIFDEAIILNKRLIAYGLVDNVMTDKNIELAYGGSSHIIDMIEKSIEADFKGKHRQ